MMMTVLKHTDNDGDEIAFVFLPSEGRIEVQIGSDDETVAVYLDDLTVAVDLRNALNAYIGSEE